MACSNSNRFVGEDFSHNQIEFKTMPSNQMIRTTTLRWALAILLMVLVANDHRRSQGPSREHLILSASGHIVLTKDEHSQSLVLTGEDGRGGKGKGGGGDRLVISGSNVGEGGQGSNMIMQDAANREGDVVINGNSMIIPGEDGHIVLSDSRRRGGGGDGPRPLNPMIFWLPYMNSRLSYRIMPFFGAQFG